MTSSPCSQPKLMHSLLSPFGRCNILTRIPRVYAAAMVEELGNQHLSEWSNVDFARGSSTGSNYCFWMPNGPDAHPDWISLHWKPNQIDDCLKSYSKLRRVFDHAYQDAHDGHLPLAHLQTLTKPALALNCELPSRGYIIQASFSPPVWELLDKRHGAVLEPVNEVVRTYWEEHLNREMPGQYGTVWQGSEGVILQMMHPVGSELSIAGAQKPRTGPFQLTDHNTDTPEQALAHIIAMCAVVAVCKEIWPAVSQQPVLQFA